MGGGFSMPQMIAKKCFRYDGRRLHTGETFSASDADMRTLSAIGFAGLASTDQPKTKRAYRRRDMRAQA